MDLPSKLREKLLAQSQAQVLKQLRARSRERNPLSYAELRQHKERITIHNAETEFDRRERLQLYYWLRTHSHIFELE